MKNQITICRVFHRMKEGSLGSPIYRFYGNNSFLWNKLYIDEKGDDSLPIEQFLLDKNFIPSGETLYTLTTE